nr:hypothetical protein [uncultured Mediterraneibacter sp.]
MLKPLISEKQKKEIGALAVEHSDALIAMGADLYRQGLIRGAILGGLSVAAGMILSQVKTAKEMDEKQNQ